MKNIVTSVIIAIIAHESSSKDHQIIKCNKPSSPLGNRIVNYKQEAGLPIVKYPKTSFEHWRRHLIALCLSPCEDTLLQRFAEMRCRSFFLL
jgi:hypothetical protein